MRPNGYRKGNVALVQPARVSAISREDRCNSAAQRTETADEADFGPG